MGRLAGIGNDEAVSATDVQGDVSYEKVYTALQTSKRIDKEP